MPTAARVIAAIMFAILGYIIAGWVKPLLPEGQPTPYLYPVSTIVPALSAWKVVGRLIGRGWTNAINTGVYGMAVALFFTLLTFAIGEMVKRSMRFQYDGPMDAIVGMFGIVLEYGVLLLTPHILATILIGGAITGIVAEWAENKWH